MKSKINQKQKTNNQKLNDPDFIFNPTTKRFIKTSSPTAKRLLESYTTDQLKNIAKQHFDNPPPRKTRSRNNDEDFDEGESSGGRRARNSGGSGQIYKINVINSQNEIINKVDQFITQDFDHTDPHNQPLPNPGGSEGGGAPIISISSMVDSISNMRNDKRIEFIGSTDHIISSSSSSGGGIKARKPVTLDKRSLQSIEIGRKILEQRKLMREKQLSELNEIKEKRFDRKNKNDLNENKEKDKDQEKNMKDPVNNSKKLVSSYGGSERRPFYIYTDGAVTNNGYANCSGGIGVYFGPGNENNLSEKFKQLPCTNQRAEVYAIIRALEIAIHDELHLDLHIKIIIYSDSMYAMNVITKVWKAKDNLDLISQAWELLKKFTVGGSNKNLEFKHIRAHTSKQDIHSIGNSMADRLALAGKSLRA